jgi:hypothetical protein
MDAISTRNTPVPSSDTPSASEGVPSRSGQNQGLCDVAGTPGALGIRADQPATAPAQTFIHCLRPECELLLTCPEHGLATAPAAREVKEPAAEQSRSLAGSLTLLTLSPLELAQLCERLASDLLRRARLILDGPGHKGRMLELSHLLRAAEFASSAGVELEPLTFKAAPAPVPVPVPAPVPGSPLTAAVQDFDGDDHNGRPVLRIEYDPTEGGGSR